MKKRIIAAAIAVCNELRQKAGMPKLEEMQ